MGQIKVQKNIAIATKTTFGIGGRVATVVNVSTPEDLVLIIKKLKQQKTPYRLISGGSNVLFGDNFFTGTVVVYRSKADCYSLKRSSGTVTSVGKIICAAGVPLAKLITLAIRHGLAGLESLSGIPGNVGGAVVGNAGAYGRSISNSIVRVQIFDGRKVKWISRGACHFGYRESIFKHSAWIVLRVEFVFTKANQADLAKRSRAIIKTRLKKYQPGLKCPGSFFKNVLVAGLSPAVLKKVDPKKIIEGKIPAGYLLQAVGACGQKQGGIEVASFHGNLLINNGRGTYADVKKLATKLKNRVKNRFGITLEEEVRTMV